MDIKSRQGANILISLYIIHKNGAPERSNLEPFDAVSLLAELEEWETELSSDPELSRLLRSLEDDAELTVAGLDVPYDPADPPASPSVPTPTRGIAR